VKSKVGAVVSVSPAQRYEATGTIVSEEVGFPDKGDECPSGAEELEIKSSELPMTIANTIETTRVFPRIIHDG